MVRPMQGFRRNAPQGRNHASNSTEMVRNSTKSGLIPAQNTSQAVMKSDTGPQSVEKHFEP